jgi:hypothetical protein
MNRTLALALLASLAVYVALFAYDSGNSHALDLSICILITVVYVGIVIHMIEDRRRWLWNAASVGIVFTTAAVAALFAFFGYQYWHGMLEPGPAQGWLDFVRTGLIVGGPIFGVAILSYRLEKAWKREPTQPGEVLAVPSAEWQPGDPDRRNGPADRRSAAEIYGRKQTES